MIAQLFAYFFPHIPPTRSNPHSYPIHLGLYIQLTAEDRTVWHDSRTYAH